MVWGIRFNLLLGFSKNKMEIKNICCIGAGYVGGPTMAVIALKCPKINVTVVDSNPEKIKAWNGPLEHIPVYEPGLKGVIKKTRGINLFFSDNIKQAIKQAEIIFMAVNTPTKTKGEGAGMAADLTFIEASARQISEYSESDKIVVEKSTLPVRTAEKIKEILSKNKKDIHFEILSNPEFLAEGTAIQDLFKSDRVLIGGDDTKSGIKAVNSLVRLYSNWIPKNKILKTNVWSSELAKLASNAMLAQRISSINSLSALCEKTGARIDEISKAIGMDHRIGPHFLKASVGFGGSCFKKDLLNLVYLYKFYGLDQLAEFWEQVIKVNEYQKNRFAKKIIAAFNGKIKNKKLAIFGWAFKANTNDSRESASIYISKILIEKGSHLKIYDPLVSEEKIKKDMNDFNFTYKKNLTIHSNMRDAINQTEGVIILTDDLSFKKINDYEKFIFDGRNIIDKSSLNKKATLISLDTNYV